MFWNLQKLFELRMDVYFTSLIIMLHKFLTSPILFQIWEDFQQDFVSPST